MNVDAYLDRLNYRGPRAPNAETLRGLHQAHMLAVPFENLDIGLGRPIRLDEAALFDKIVHRRRGGFCYELNGLFAALLTALGFDVNLLSARVCNDNVFGPEFDHLALLVQLEEPWLADVGFGDCFVEQLRLVEGEQVHASRDRAYRLALSGEEWVLGEQRGAGMWEAVYAFRLQPHRLADFGPMCHYQQTSPNSHFTQHRVCTRATANGRITIRDQRLTIHSGAERTETELPDKAAFNAALREHFGMHEL